jgi:hypothetical protein
MRREYVKHKKHDKYKENISRKILKEKGHLEILDVDGKIIIKLIVMK